MIFPWMRFPSANALSETLLCMNSLLWAICKINHRMIVGFNIMEQSGSFRNLIGRNTCPLICNWNELFMFLIFRGDC